MNVQADNFLKILNTAFTGEVFELTVPDWNALAKMAQLQSVVPLFYEGVCRYDASSPSAEYKNRLFSRSAAVLSHQSRRTALFLKAYDALLSADIKPLILKGLICRITYGDFSDHRPSSDEDIYIQKSEFAECSRVLTSLGYTADPAAGSGVIDKFQEISFRSPSGLVIEVHLNLFGKENKNRLEMNAVFASAFENAVPVDFTFENKTHTLYTLSFSQHYLFLFLHLYKHFTCSGVGIRQVIDLAMFDRAFHDKIDFDFVENSLRAFNAGKLYADTLALAGRLGFNMKSSFKAHNPDLLLSEMIDSGTFGNTDSKRALSRYITLNALDGRVKVNKPKFLAAFFPPVSVLVTGYPLLADKPWLLPFVWVQRAFKKAKRGSLGKTLADNKETVEIGQRRIDLMKEYDLL